MDKIAIPDVDPYMGGIFYITLGFEKNQVSNRQFFFRNLVADLELLPGTSRKLNIENVIDLFYESRTIESTNRLSTIFIRRTMKPLATFTSMYFSSLLCQGLKVLLESSMSSSESSTSIIFGIRTTFGSFLPVILFDSRISSLSILNFAAILSRVHPFLADTQ